VEPDPLPPLPSAPVADVDVDRPRTANLRMRHSRSVETTRRDVSVIPGSITIREDKLEVKPQESPVAEVVTQTSAVRVEPTRNEVRAVEPIAAAPASVERVIKPAVVPALTRVAAATRQQAVDSGATVHFVNSKRICLNYQIWNAVGARPDVELWYTRDGQTWQKHAASPQHSAPYVADVEDEDLYGFTTVGNRGARPQPGDKPQVWIEVDLTPPAVHLRGTECGTGDKAGTLTIVWSAGDKNIEAQPITIGYASDPSGPWTPIVSGMKNTGSYAWHPTSNVPQRFYVRVEAVDRAGNVGVAQTPTPISFDGGRPGVQITSVQGISNQ
jgi:hypothetical protein